MAVGRFDMRMFRRFVLVDVVHRLVLGTDLDSRIFCGERYALLAVVVS